MHKTLKAFHHFVILTKKGLSVRNDEVNISCCAKELFNESSKKLPHTDSQQDIQVEATEGAETTEEIFFARMQYLLMLNYIGKDPEKR